MLSPRKQRRFACGRSFSHQVKLSAKDDALKQQIEAMHRQHPAYGHRRMAVHLGINHKQAQRVMAKLKLRPLRAALRRLSRNTWSPDFGQRYGPPWQNGLAELFYGRFKHELGNVNRFASAGEIIEAIYQHILYCNHDRIHIALKMPPAVFAA